MDRRKVAGNNSSDLTERNRSAVVRIIKQRGVCSRAEIAKSTGLTQAAITKIVAALLEIGIVSEIGIVPGAGGRRSIGLELNAGRYRVVGVKFARQSFSVGVFDISGREYEQKTVCYKLDDDPKEVLRRMKAAVGAYLEQYPHIVAIGLAVPGPYLRREGRFALITQMPAWGEVDFRRDFGEAFDRPVFIEHDANAGVLAEWWFGAGRQPTRTLAYFLLGEGVGAGVMDRGELLLGAQGISGEIGHVSMDVNGPRCECGNYGCLELYCSAPAMVKRAQQADDVIHSVDEVFDRARCGDTAMRAVVEETARYIGYGCVTLINTYNPEVILIGDVLSAGGDLFLPTVQQVVNERILPAIAQQTTIRMTEFTVDPILYGAAALATDEVLKLPTGFSGDPDRSAPKGSESQ